MYVSSEYELPTQQLNSEITNIFDFKESDIHLMNYSSHPAIKAPMAV
jgi:thymidylate synthase